MNSFAINLVSLQIYGLDDNLYQDTFVEGYIRTTY
jgi:hypothetical protein